MHEMTENARTVRNRAAQMHGIAQVPLGTVHSCSASCSGGPSDDNPRFRARKREPQNRVGVRRPSADLALAFEIETSVHRECTKPIHATLNMPYKPHSQRIVNPSVSQSGSPQTVLEMQRQCLIEARELW